MSKERNTVIDLGELVQQRRREQAREVGTQRWKERLTRAGLNESTAAAVAENREVFAITFGLGVGLGVLMMMSDSDERRRVKECVERCKAEGEG